MAIVRVQTAHNEANSAAPTVTFASPPTDGNLLIAVISSGDTVLNGSVGTVSGITETNGSWHKAVSSSNGTTEDVEVWYYYNIASAGSAITPVITVPGTGGCGIAIAEYSGFTTTDPLDVTASNSGTGTTTDSGTTATTAQAIELWIANITNFTGASSSSPTNGFSIVSDNPSQENACVLFEKIVSSTGTANTGATITSALWRGVIATFKGLSFTTTTKTLTGKSRIQITSTQTLTGKANIKNTTSQTITGKANIMETTTRTLTGKASIVETTTKTLTGKANIKVTTTQTLTGKANITETTDKTITGKGAVKKTTSQTLTGKANIDINETITGKASIWNNGGGTGATNLHQLKLTGAGPQ